MDENRIDKVTCPKCGNQNSSSMKFCVFCNNPLDVQTPVQNTTQNMEPALVQSQQNPPKYCPYCGSANESINSFCCQCGSSLVNQDIQYPTANQQSQKTKEKPTPVIWVLAIVSTLLSLAIPYFVIITIIAAFLSLLNEKTSPYGILVFKILGVLFLLLIIFIIIMFGVCVVAIGNSGL